MLTDGKGNKSVMLTGFELQWTMVTFIERMKNKAEVMCEVVLLSLNFTRETWHSVKDVWM